MSAYDDKETLQYLERDLRDRIRKLRDDKEDGTQGKYDELLDCVERYSEECEILRNQTEDYKALVQVERDSAAKASEELQSYLDSYEMIPKDGYWKMTKPFRFAFRGVKFALKTFKKGINCVSANGLSYTVRRARQKTAELLNNGADLEPSPETSREAASAAQNEANGFYTLKELARQDWCRLHPLDERVKFSIITPVYNTPLPVLEAMILSVKNQIYHNWELCIADASTDKKPIRELVGRLSQGCERIKYRALDENGGISRNTAAAMEMASGDFIALLDHDDMIAPNALYEFAEWLNIEPQTDFFYSDKDTIDESGTKRINALYKPEYSPEIMYSANYFTHFCAIRSSVLNETGGFDSEADGAQDWDIFLKVMRRTENIKRIRRILYHWRIISTSVASGLAAKPYVLDAQLYALKNYVREKNWPADIYFHDKMKSQLKVDWKFREDISAAVVSISGSGTKEADIQGAARTVCVKRGDAKSLESVVTNACEDVLLFVDADVCTSFSEEIVSELSSWVLHPEIAFAAPQLRKDGKILSCGLVYDSDSVMDLFGGNNADYYGQIGGALWYRDLSGFRGECLAIERTKFTKLFHCDADMGYFDLACNTFAAHSYRLRNVYTPYAWAETKHALTQKDLQADFAAVAKRLMLPKEDPYFNSDCKLDILQPVKKSSRKEALSAASIEALTIVRSYDFTLGDLHENFKIIGKKSEGDVKSIIWFLPEFDYVFYAGVYTIFRTASYVQRVHGITNSFVFLSNRKPEEMMKLVGKGFPELLGCTAFCITNYERLKSIGCYDASVCTLWTTAYYSLRFNGVKRKFYFIQDYEPLFYAGNSVYAQCEATYRFGFYGIANTRGLKDVYEKEYGGKAVSLDPAIDDSIFYPNKQRNYNREQYDVFFYGRPSHPRNGFELGIEAMRILKKKMGKRVRIITAGADYNVEDYALQGIVENMGRLSVEETGALYRRCDAGMVMMYTRHPSYLPYELMACGCCVVSNYNAYTKWFLKDEVNAVVCEPSATGIAEKIEALLNNPERRRRISEQGVEQAGAEKRTWDESLEAVYRFIQDPEGIKVIK